MQKVLTAEQMREVDRLSTEQYGIPSILLMENAAHAVARVITKKLGGSVNGKSILILCGKGNNGGDGAAAARILWTQGACVEAYLVGLGKETGGDADINFNALEKLGCSSLRVKAVQDSASLFAGILSFQAHRGSYDIVVDALFGTGLSRPLGEPYSTIVDDLNKYFTDERPSPVRISLDIPSGLDSDSAQPIGSSFTTDTTITFTAPKPANVLTPVAALSGELVVVNIGSPIELIDAQPSRLFTTETSDVGRWLAKTGFSDDSFKNKRGHALLIAGSESYSGAAVLCGNAAMRSGVGLVTVATPKSSKDSVASRVLPEIMVRGIAETENGAISELAFDELDELFEKADSVAVGSGLSQDESTEIFVKKVVENRRQPTIVDADALNLLSPFANRANKGPDADGTSRECPLILTPHEGEFMRLIGTTDKEAVKDRVAAVREFATKHEVILVLKGERVLIGSPDGMVVVNPTGNSGLGKAGNGDTLTGILAGFVAQAVSRDVDIFETVAAAVYVAGMAGDIAEKKYGKRVMTASDVRECLSEVFSTLSEPSA